MRAQRRCIIFLHIPKTAGSTLRATLRYKHPSESLDLRSTSQPLEAIEKVPLSERRTARIVAGHLHYGVHRHIPQECRYITVLREPVARAISTYHYLLGRPQHWFHDELVRSGMGVEGLVRSRVGSVAGPADNLQTRFISGRRQGALVTRGSDGRLEPTELGAEALREAKRNLDGFLVVGLTERFDESFILVRRALGWKLPMYADRNVSKRPPRPEPQTREAIDLIRERDQLDLELYDHAEKLFQAAVERGGASFRREVAAFRVLNRIPNAVGPRIPASWRHPLRSALGRTP
jgi:hypothetical protein